MSKHLNFIWGKHTEETQHYTNIFKDSLEKAMARRKVTASNKAWLGYLKQDPCAFVP